MKQQEKQQETETPDESAFEALLAAYIDGEEEVTFTLPRGEVFRAKRLRDASEMRRLKREIDEKYQIIQSGACPVRLRPFKKVEYEILSRCFMAARLIVEPKLTFEHWLRLSQTCGTLIDLVTNPLLKTANVVEQMAAAQEIDDAKNS